MSSACRILILFASLLNMRLFATDAGQWKIQVIGISIAAPQPQTKTEAHDQSFAPSEVRVAFKITPTVGKIVGLNAFHSKLIFFTDDKGADLLAMKSDSPINRPGFSVMETKPTSVAVEIHTPVLPSKGATELNISGTLSVKVARETKQFIIEDVDLKANTSFMCGDLPIKIKEAGMGKSISSFSDELKFRVTFSSAMDLESIASLEFFDLKGNKVEARRDEWGGGAGEYSAIYSFKQAVDRAKIVATCWQGLQTVEVPVSIKTGLGL